MGRVLGKAPSGRVLGQAQPEADTSLRGRFKEAAERSDVKKAATTKARAEGKIGLLETGVQHAGQAVGLGFDLFSELPVVKPTLEAFGKGIGAFSETPRVQEAADVIQPGVEKGIEFFEGLSPERQATLKASGELALVAPVSKLGQVGLKTGAKVTGAVAEPTGRILGKAGTTLKESGVAKEAGLKNKFLEDLVTPTRTKAVKEAEVPRTGEIGEGITKRSVVETTGFEKEVIDQVSKIKGVGEKNTIQGNYNLIDKANVNLAKSLKKDIAENDFAIPRKETLSRLTKAKEILKEEALIVGDAEKTAAKLLVKAEQLINKADGTGSGIFQARKDFDAHVIKQKPKVFDSNSENALTVANREIRDTFTDLLDEKAIDIAVRDRLREQRRLFTALDNMTPKAAKEANTAIGRAYDRLSAALGTRNKIVQGLAAAAGIGVFGAAQAFAAPLTLGTAALFLTFKGGKFILKPGVRKALGNVLEKAGHLLAPEEKVLIKNILDNAVDGSSPLGQLGASVKETTPSKKPKTSQKANSSNNDTTKP